MSYENFKLEIDADGIALVTFDMPGRSMNVLSDGSIGELVAITGRIKTDAAIKGAVFTSGKPAFCAGADLAMMEKRAEAIAAQPTPEARAKLAYEGIRQLTDTFRAIETCGKPVAAAINGTALGGGYELALACHYRIAADNPKTQIGLPEAKVGLLPGAGGTQRLPRLIGAATALPLILEGKSVDPKTALGMGMVHEVVPQDALIAAAKRWIKEKGDPKQPWDKDGFVIPGGGPYSDAAHQQFVAGNALLMKQTYGNYEAQKAIMSCVYEGLQVPIDAGLRIEARYITKLMLGPQSRNMIRTLFLSMQELGKLARRPQAIPPSQVRKLGILGAGMMGAGIAYVSALAGMEVVLIDMSEEAAEKGKTHSRSLLEKAVQKGRQTQEGADTILARITPTASYDKLKGCDLVIEAVFEDRAVKADVTKKAEAQVAKPAIFGSNTSTLPITGLAEVSARPENFIGIHFFSPVDRMPLVELILGKKTSSETLAKAMDYVQAIRKTPIVVNDSRGFYTSRAFATYGDEGLQMLAEGYLPAIIDNVGRMTGMPRGPLEITDDVALDLAWKVREQTIRETGVVPGIGDEILRRMVVDLKRHGRKNGKGFYDYPANGRKRLWPGLSDLAEPKIFEAPPPVVKELKTRFLYRQALEAARCVEESVVTDPRDADVGAILGWGFAPYTGGPLSIIDTAGAKAFVEICEGFEKRFGPRWKPNALLIEMAKKGETFYGRFGTKKAA